MKLQVDKNIELELVTEAHAKNIFELVDANRAYLKEWLPWVEATKSIIDSIAYIEKSKKLTAENNEFVFSILFNTEIVGLIGLHSIDHTNKRAKIGYWIAPNYQGNGIVTKASRAIENYCFEEMDLNRIEIFSGTKNYKSQAIPERLNFKKEGIIREAEFLNNTFIDHFLYSKLKSEWKNYQ